MSRRVFKPSKRELYGQYNATEAFYAAAADKEPPTPRFIAPKRIRRPVDGKPPQASEHQEQAAVISWWYLAHHQYKLPVFALFAVPNGGARDAITGSMLKAEGVRPGTPDLILAKPNRKFAGLLLEMKKIGAPQPPDDQIAFRDYLLSVGYSAGFHYGSESAIEAIKSYLGYDDAIALLPA